MVGADPDGPAALPGVVGLSVPLVDDDGMLERLRPRFILPVEGEGVLGRPGAVDAPGPAPAGLGGAPPAVVWAKAAPVDNRATAPAARSRFLMGGSSFVAHDKLTRALMD